MGSLPLLLFHLGGRYPVPRKRGGTLSFIGGGVEYAGIPPSRTFEWGYPPSGFRSVRRALHRDSIGNRGRVRVAKGGWYPVFRTTGGEGVPLSGFGEGPTQCRHRPDI
jgi:hypothetical protein